ncbi:MAG TPA: hypothetical protein PKW30_02525, partial [Campylobacterales bacterium]|nr:hypothetical protein [Campylobacterales bacterium]
KADLEKYCKAIDGEFMGRQDIANNAKAKVDSIFNKKGLSNSHSCSLDLPYGVVYDSACVKNKRALFLVNSNCFDSYRLETYHDRCVKNTVSKTGIYSNEWDIYIDGTKENEAAIEKSAQKCISTQRTLENSKQAKADEKKAKQKVVEQLRSRIGIYEMTFYDKFQFKWSEQECSDKCINLNLQTSGYISLNEALKNGWEPTGTVLGDEQINPDKYNSCTCIGKRLILKRTKIPKTSYYER